MAPISPFKISVSDEELQRLKTKLQLTDFPNELDDAAWHYGAPLLDIRRFWKHWTTSYDWRLHEKNLNELPQFTTDVEVEDFGIVNMHFVHQQSLSRDAIPLLFVHGWPGSFIEVAKLVPLLTKGTDQASFHVVAPSLPNFGFSSRVAKTGFGIPQYAEACHKVMNSLGYNEYVTQGGDWGHIITHVIGLRYPKHCKANHTNMPNSRNADKPDPSKLDARDQRMLQRREWFRAEGSGYYHEQSTKPQTLGYGLRDSPIALLAWIFEKLHDWTDNYPWTEDEVLTWICIYYFSRAGPDASSFIYREANFAQSSLVKDNYETAQCPIALAYFPQEIVAQPASTLSSLGPIKQVTYFAQGGHFAAHERPEDLANDLFKFYGKNGPIADIVPRMKSCKLYKL